MLGRRPEWPADDDGITPRGLFSRQRFLGRADLLERRQHYQQIGMRPRYPTEREGGSFLAFQLGQHRRRIQLESRHDFFSKKPSQHGQGGGQRFASAQLNGDPLPQFPGGV